MKIISQQPPSALAIGDAVLRERNQRAPKTASRKGSRKTPTPKNCKKRSEKIAPMIPTQFRAEWESVSAEALFNDGSSGEYDARARKRRTAETNSRKPISSFNRRLLVGTKARAKYLMGRGYIPTTAQSKPA